MPKTAYHISLKGYVGGYDFDSSTVDRELAKNEGKQVHVLIDSLGGSLATGLSISAAFKNSGNANVHFVGLNASAATIASLGVSHFHSITRRFIKNHRKITPSLKLSPYKLFQLFSLVYQWVSTCLVVILMQ